MIIIEPYSQLKLIGLNEYFLEFLDLYHKDKLPNKILLSGSKGIGKSTLAYHLINYILSENEEFQYDLTNLRLTKIINPSKQF